MTRGVAPNRTTIGFALILIAALLAVAVAATRTQTPGIPHLSPSAGSAEH
jgi:hypothetical protein